MTRLILCALVPITLVVTGLLCFLLLASATRKRKDSLLKNIENEIGAGKLRKADATLSRVKIISKSNSQYDKLFNKISEIHDDLCLQYELIEKGYASLVTNKTKSKYKIFYNKIQEIRKDIEKLNDIENRFNFESQEITQQDEFLRTEMSFYSANLRKAINVYRQKRILLDGISSKIDGISNLIKKYDKEFNIYLDSANIPEANGVLLKYSKKVIYFAEIINEGPSLQSYLYITIPKLVDGLVAMYNKKKTEASGTLEHINFASSVKDIANKFKLAKQNFMNLELEEAKIGIKEILKSLKIIERQIDYEVKSQNLFISNYKKSIILVNKSLDNNNHLQQQVKKLIGKSHQLPFELLELNKAIQELVGVIENTMQTFGDSSKSGNLAYSSKLTRMKLLLQKTTSLNEKINEALAIVWSLNIEKIVFKNKFIKAEAALNDVVANSKRQNIILTDREKASFKELSRLLTITNKFIDEEVISKQHKENVDDIVQKTTDYYEAVGGKIQIANIVKNLVRDLSPKRAIKKVLNEELIIAENHYLQGKYDAALNTIINHLESEV